MTPITSASPAIGAPSPEIMMGWLMPGVIIGVSVPIGTAVVGNGTA